MSKLTFELVSVHRYAFILKGTAGTRAECCVSLDAAPLLCSPPLQHANYGANSNISHIGELHRARGEAREQDAARAFIILSGL